MSHISVDWMYTAYGEFCSPAAKSDKFPAYLSPSLALYTSSNTIIIIKIIIYTRRRTFSTTLLYGQVECHGRRMTHLTQSTFRFDLTDNQENCSAVSKILFEKLRS